MFREYLCTQDHFQLAKNQIDYWFCILAPELLERGELSFNAAGAMERDTLLAGITLVPSEDVCRSSSDYCHAHHQEFEKCYQLFGKSSSVIVNTFEKLEAKTFKALRTDYVAANIKVSYLVSHNGNSIPQRLKSSSRRSKYWIIFFVKQTSNVQV